MSVSLQVRMVVARPVEPNSTEFQTLASSAPIVPTKILTDPEELDRTLLQNGYSSFCTYNQSDYYEQTEIESNSVDVNQLNDVNTLDTITTNNNTINSNDCSPSINEKLVIEAPVDIEYDTLPETDRFSVVLNKNEFGLGITIAGYVCEREDLSGIFVKSLNEGSEAFKCGRIHINDRIVAVDDQPLHDCTNYEAVEKLKQTSSVVSLSLERYLRGPKYEQLQEALASQEQRDISPASPSVTTLSWIPIEATEVSFKRKCCQLIFHT